MRMLLLGLLLLAGQVLAASAPENLRFLENTDGIRAIRTLAPSVNVQVLAAGVAESATIPSGSKFVIFSSNCNEFYVRKNATAAVPVADVTDGTGSELNVGSAVVEDVTTLSLISPTSCTITMAFYK